MVDKNLTSRAEATYPLVPGENFLYGVQGTGTPNTRKYDPTKFGLIWESQVTGGANVEIPTTTFDADASYLFRLRNVSFSVDSIIPRLEMSINGGSTYLNSGYGRSLRAWSPNTQEQNRRGDALSILELSREDANFRVGNAAGEGGAFDFRLINMGTGHMKMIDYNGWYVLEQNDPAWTFGILSNTTLSAVDRLRFTANSGNVTAFAQLIREY